MPSRLRDRPTPDLIVIYLAAIVGVVLMATAVTLLVEAIWYPDHNSHSLATKVGAMVSSLIAVIVGYLAGRGVNGRKETP